MIEHKFPFESFIGGWYIDESICDDIINYYDKNKNDANEINTRVNNQKEIALTYEMMDKKFGNYTKALQNVLENYMEKYKPHLYNLNRFYIKENTKIQRYRKNEGYHGWHCENEGWKKEFGRHLVFMTYLNDVEDGGTSFKYQGIDIPAKKGLTLIWPAYWTHIHKGQVSRTKEKTIITGWYYFKQDDN